MSILFLLLCCSSNHESLEVIQETTDYPITLRLSPKYKKIIGIKFPQRIKIKNRTIKRIAFVKIDYEYNSIPKKRSYGISLFKEESGYLKKISNNKKKEIAPYNEREYVFYTRHFIDTISSIQNVLKPYITKMIELNQDTLSIGTISEFKRSHNDLLKILTKNDSISIRLIDKNTKSGLSKSFSYPIKL